MFLGVVTVLLEGPPNSGKTALACQLAKMSNFPFVKVCSPEDMVGFSESAKCLSIRKVRINIRNNEVNCGEKLIKLVFIRFLMTLTDPH